MQPQDLAITILGAHVREDGETVWSGGMVTLLGEFGFTTEAARAALARLVLRGLLARHKQGRLVHYALTPRAQELLTEGDRRIFTFGRAAPTGEAWTVLWHSIPEDRRVERSRLGRRLRFLGFGSVQDATWVAAADRERDVLDLLRALELAPFASVFVGRPSAALLPEAIVAAAWDLDGLACVYESFLDQFGPLRRARTRRALDDRSAFVERTRMLHFFRELPFQDPELPDAIATLRRLRERVVSTFDDVYTRLEPAAAAHFEAVAQPHIPDRGAVRPRGRTPAPARGRGRSRPATGRRAP